MKVMNNYVKSPTYYNDEVYLISKTIIFGIHRLNSIIFKTNHGSNANQNMFISEFMNLFIIRFLFTSLQRNMKDLSTVGI